MLRTGESPGAETMAFVHNLVMPGFVP